MKTLKKILQEIDNKEIRIYWDNFRICFMPRLADQDKFREATDRIAFRDYEYKDIEKKIKKAGYKLINLDDDCPHCKKGK